MGTETLPYTVTELNQRIRLWLEHDIGTVRVEGELSNVSRPTSGHVYFTLKDAAAQIRCVYFRNRQTQGDKNGLTNGQHVLATGTLSLYEARGDYQLIVERLEEAGLGNLYLQFELLKEKLKSLGLFDAIRKKTVPRFPKVIGVVTSSSGAALRDILSTLSRRYPIANVVVYASEVQGKQSAMQLTNAIHLANHEARCDVLLLARGGGSMEDLWAFNDEHLAHAIAGSRIPIVSGIGHETDITIADFVADLRAATPTAAAEAVTPNVIDLKILIDTLENRLQRAITRFTQHKQLVLHHVLQKMAAPKHRIHAYEQSIDYLTIRLKHAILQTLATRNQQLQDSSTRLEARNPTVLLQKTRAHLQQIESQLSQQISFKMHQLKHQFNTLLTTLHAVSPLATLSRGYAIATSHQKVITDSAQVAVGDTISIRLAKGCLKTLVTNKEN